MSLSNSISFFFKLSLLFIVLFLGVYNSNASVYSYVLPEGEISGADIQLNLESNNVTEDTVKLIINDGVTVKVSQTGSDWNLTNYEVVIIDILGSDTTELGGGSLIIPKKSNVFLSEKSQVLVDFKNSKGLVGEHKSKSHLNIGLAVFHGGVFNVITQSGGAHSEGFGSRAPVELYSFVAKKRDKASVFIEWTTVHEENSHHYEIQKSYDGVAFYTLGEVSSVGESEDFLSYSFQDMVSFSSSTIYYRLAHVDFAGGYTELEVQRID